MFTDAAKNRIRDLLSADIYNAGLGTDGTTPTSSDTALGAAVSATDATPTITTGNKTLNVSHVLLSTTSAGTTFKEFGVRLNGGATLLNRVVFPDFAHTANDELHTTVIYRIN